MSQCVCVGQIEINLEVPRDSQAQRGAQALEGGEAGAPAVGNTPCSGKVRRYKGNKLKKKNT